jgi:uncharacterized protein (TIGR03067 family)
MLFLEMLYLLPGSVGTAEAPRENAAERDLNQMRGDWVLVSLEENGKQATEARRKEVKVSITADGRYIFTAGDETHTGYYKLGPTRTPRAMDIILEEGPLKGKVQLAIYEFDGAYWRVAAADPGRDRPQGFTPAAGIIVEVWRRQ